MAGLTARILGTFRTQASEIDATVEASPPSPQRPPSHAEEEELPETFWLHPPRWYFNWLRVIVLTKIVTVHATMGHLLESMEKMRVRKVNELKDRLRRAEGMGLPTIPEGFTSLPTKKGKKTAVDAPMAKGKPIARSKTKKWRTEPDDCLHPPHMMSNPRGGRAGHVWWTCEECGSRWERVHHSQLCAITDGTTPTESSGLQIKEQKQREARLQQRHEITVESYMQALDVLDHDSETGGPDHPGYHSAESIQGIFECQMDDLSKMISAVTIKDYRQAKELLKVPLQQFPRFTRYGRDSKMMIPSVRIHAQKIVDNYETAMTLQDDTAKKNTTWKESVPTQTRVEKRSVPSSSNTPEMDVDPEHSWQEIWQMAEATYTMHMKDHGLTHAEALQQVVLAAKPSEITAVMDFLTAMNTEVSVSVRP